MTYLLGPLRTSGCRCVTGFTSMLTTTLPTTVTTTPPHQITQTRGKKKAAASAEATQGKNKSKTNNHPGPKVQLDQFVQPGQMLFKQKVGNFSGFKMHPGRNVDVGRDNTLFARREGYVKVTEDVVEIPEHKGGPYVERMFIHVEERPRIRRLQCLNPQSLSNVVMFQPNS